MRSAWLAIALAACCQVEPAAPCVEPAPSDTADAPSAGQPPGNPLELTADSPLRHEPAWRDKLAQSPHHYFRGVNKLFAQAVCQRFEPVMATLPTVNLHGDAHLEQVAVTAKGAGLSDFDDSVSGPPVIDLVRFGTSAALAAKQHGFSVDALVTAFLDAYAAGLESDAAIEPPQVLLDLRADASQSPKAFLESAEELMAEPVPPDKVRESEQSWARFVALMLQIHPDKERTFFSIKSKGQPTSLGVGSASTKRVLYRIEGPTDAPGDDLVLEAKEMRDISAIGCVDGRSGLSVRIIASATRFGAQADPFLAIVPRDPNEPVDDQPWWVQSWWPTYAEVVVADLDSQAKLAAVTGFAARQLARGHTSYLPPPYHLQLRSLVGNMLREHRVAIHAAIVELVEQAWQAHAGFVSSTAGPPETTAE